MATFLQEWKTYFLSSGTSTPYPRDKRGMIRVYLDSQSTANNTSTISINHYVQMYNNTWDLGSAGVPNNTSSYRCNNGSFGGTYQTKSIGTQYSSPYSNYTNKLIGTTTHTVTHNADGTCQLYVNGSYSDDEQTKTSSFNIALPTIPRATTITSFTWDKASGAAGLSTLTCNWATANAIDRIQYSLNGGAYTTVTGSGTSGSFNISGLTPNTQYSLKIKVKRADSQVETESGTLYATTYDIAKITNGNVDFNVDNGITVNFTNPSGSKTDVWIEGINQIGGTAQYAIPIRENVSSPFVYTLTQAEKNTLFNNNSTRDKFPIRIAIRTSNNNAYVTWKDGYASITNANPTFTNWTYADTNATTIALTGNNQKIIKGYSNVKATITSANKMVAIKGATGKSYQLTIGEKKATANYSPSSTVEMTLNAVDNSVFDLYAIDSRGNSTKVQKTATTYLTYTPIVILTATGTRTDGIGSQTTLAFNGTFYNASFGSTTNTIKTATYKFKKTSDSIYTDGTSIITPTPSGNTFSFSGTIKGDAGTGGVNGFDATYSYNIQVIVTDELSTHTFNFILGSGKPNIAIHQDGVAINQPYDETLGGALQVNGPAYENGIRIANINQLYKTGPTIADLNNALTDGCYTFSNGSNGPAGIVYGTVFVVNAGGLTKGSTSGYCNQLFFDAQSNKIWYRKKIDGIAWGAWVRLITQDDRVVLFNGTASASITLSENAGNFEYLMVWFSDGSMNNSVTVKNTGVFDITHSRFGSFDGYYGLRLSTGTITVNGTTVYASGIGSNYTADLRFGNTLVVSDTKVTYTITKVIGFR